MSLDKVLIIDEQHSSRIALAKHLKGARLEVLATDGMHHGLRLLSECPYDLVMISPYTAGIPVEDLIQRIVHLQPKTLIILLLDRETHIEKPVGCFDILHKPFDEQRMYELLQKVQEEIISREEDRYLHCKIAHKADWKLDQIIAESGVMKKILADANKIAKSKASVFINGESGTGKEVLAHAIHFLSKRRNQPFIKVNCAAIPETLIESEFFGHEKGSFTGAVGRRFGRFELAHKGTLLLDEISEIPIGLQAKMLRVLQEKEFERVGGNESVKVDVRIIATSNRNMQQAIDEKLFREDLYFRLNVIPLKLPPLRERRDDIIPLAEYFLLRFCEENEVEHKTLSPEAKKLLLDYPWPGNIRELGNVIERSVVLHPENVLDASAFSLQTNSTPAIVSFAPRSLEELEREHILLTLAEVGNNKTKAAEILGISARTLRNKLAGYDK